MSKRWVPVALGTLIALALPPSGAGAATAVNGGGSSFVGIEVDTWRVDVAKPPYGVTINYQSTGSSFGREGFINGSLDFGISDIQFQKEESEKVQQKRPNYTLIPISAGGVAFMYNLTDAAGQRVSDLKLSPRTVCGIFTGYITKWNDPAVVADTGHPMPDKTLYPVVRADGSGQSFVLSQYCIDQAKDLWEGFIDKLNASGGDKAFEKSETSNWPTGWGAVRSANFTDGVADVIADSSNGDATIGYVETGFAEQRHMPVASVKNASGRFTQPEADHVTNALKFASVRADNTHLLSFRGAGDDVYYPSTYSYLIAQTNGFDAGKGKALGTFLNYALTKGQAKAKTLGYAPLSPNLVAIGLDQVAKIPGAPKCEETPGCERPSGAGVTTATTAPTGGSGGTTGGGTGGGGTGGGGTTDTSGGTTGPTAGGATTATTARTGAGTGTQVSVGNTTATTRRSGTSTRSATGSPSAAAAGVAALPSTGVDAEVGPLGATGGEHQIVAAAGAILALGGEFVRRRHRRPAQAPR